MHVFVASSAAWEHAVPALPPDPCQTYTTAQSSNAVLSPPWSHPGHTLPVVTPGTRMLNLIQGAARCCTCCWPVVPSRHHFMGGSSKLEGHWSGDSPTQHVGCLPSQMHLPSSNRLLHTGVPCCMGAAQQAAWLSNTHRQTEQAKMVGGCSAAHKQSPA